MFNRTSDVYSREILFPGLNSQSWLSISQPTQDQPIHMTEHGHVSDDRLVMCGGVCGAMCGGVRFALVVNCTIAAEEKQLQHSPVAGNWAAVARGCSARTHAHTRARLTALCPGLTG